MIAAKQPAARFLHIGHLPPHPRWAMAAHLHTYHQLIVILNGCLRLRIGGTRCEARTGDLLVYHRGVPHEESSDPAAPVETYYLDLESSQVDALPGVLHDRAGRVRDLAHWIYADRHSALPETVAARGANFASLCCELQRLARQTTQVSDLVADVRSFIRLHLGEPLSLDRLAENAGLSKFHFCRLFHRLSGHAPMQEVRLLRVSHARDLLLTTNLPLKAIAAQVGFADEFHLSHVFRRQHGVAPSTLRRRHR